MAEIEFILKKGLDTMIKQKALEKFAFRLYDVLVDVLKRVDLEIYGQFKAIMLKEGKEWDEAFSDVSQEDRLAIQSLATEFFEVPLMRCLINFRCSKITSLNTRKWR